VIDDHDIVVRRPADRDPVGNDAPGFFASGYSSISTGSGVNLPCGMVSSTASPRSSSIVIVSVAGPAGRDRPRGHE